MRTITAIVIGGSQQGKSTLVSELLKVPTVRARDATEQDKNADDRIVVGDGNTEVTINTKLYSAKVPIMKHWFMYKNMTVVGDIHDESNELAYITIMSDAERKRSTLTNYLTHKAEVTIGSEPTGDDYVLNLIDTPGLDGTKIDDDTHLATVLTMLSKHSNMEVNAVIFVVKYTTNYGAKFIEMFKQYCKMLPGLTDKIIVVQTNFTDDIVQKNERDNGQSIMTRISNFQEYIIDDQKLVVDPKHHFIDLVVHPDDPPYKTHRYNVEIQGLLSMIASTSPRIIGQLHYYKTPAIRNTDKLIKIKIEDKIESNNVLLQTTILHHDALSGQAKEDLVSLGNRINSCNSEIARKNTEIRDKDTDQVSELVGQIDVHKKNQFINTILGIAYERRTINATGPITHRELTPGYGNEFKDEDFIPHSNRYAVTLKRTHWFDADLVGHVRLYSHHKTYFNDRIVVLRREVAEQQALLTEMRIKRQSIEDRIEHKNEEQTRLMTSINTDNDRLHSTATLVDSEYMDIKDFLATKDMYKQGMTDDIMRWYTNKIE